MNIKSKKSAKQYAAEMSDLHGEKWFPIERITKEKKFINSINFWAANKNDTDALIASGEWKVVD